MEPTNLAISCVVPGPMMAGRREKQDGANKSCYVQLRSGVNDGREKRKARWSQQILLILV